MTPLTAAAFLLAGMLWPQSPATQPPAPTADNPPTAAQVMPRVAPPSPTASARELEDIADGLREQKAYLDCLDYYQAALKKNSQSAQLHNKVGIAYLQMAKPDQARKSFERATKLDPALAEAWNNLGVVQYVRKDYKKAIRYYRKAIMLHDESASFHSNLGTAHFDRKEFEEATREYLRAMELDPDIFERRSRAGVSAHLPSPEDRARYDYLVARMYARQGNVDRSLIYLRKAVEEGYAKIDSVYKDEEFAAIRQDKRFAELMARRPQPIPN